MPNDDRLHHAVLQDDEERVRQLLVEGVPVDLFDEIGKTPLHYAAAAGHLQLIRLLIEAGADVNAHDERLAGNTPLAQVAGNCSYEVARLLIEAGADPTIPGWMQLSALDRARQRAPGRLKGPRTAGECRQDSPPIQAPHLNA